MVAIGILGNALNTCLECQTDKGKRQEVLMYNDRLLFCLHGFLRTGASMWWLNNTLSELGYKERFTPTFGLHLHSLEHNAHQLPKQILDELNQTGDSIN